MLRALAVLLAAAAVRAADSFDCGTGLQHASDEFLAAIQGHHESQSSGSPAARAAQLAARADNKSAMMVDTVFHIVTKASEKDDITSDMPQQQLGALNDAYQPYGIQFNLVNVSWTVNDDWAVGASNDSDAAMKKALRQGSYATMNMYFQTDLAGGVLGRCTLPSPLAPPARGRRGRHGARRAAAADPAVYASDGCNVNANTMPGGAMDGYNSGKTAVHEAGHWLGLLHTFEGNACSGAGDYIDDTPFEAQSTNGCPSGKQSCPGQAGADHHDPIHNYMDYSTDACYTQFTPLQHDRMHYMFNLYRAGN